MKCVWELWIILHLHLPSQTAVNNKWRYIGLWLFDPRNFLRIAEAHTYYLCIQTYRIIEIWMALCTKRVTQDCNTWITSSLSTVSSANQSSYIRSRHIRHVHFFVYKHVTSNTLFTPETYAGDITILYTIPGPQRSKARVCGFEARWRHVCLSLCKCSELKWPN